MYGTNNIWNLVCAMFEHIVLNNIFLYTFRYRVPRKKRSMYLKVKNRNNSGRQKSLCYSIHSAFLYVSYGQTKEVPYLCCDFYVFVFRKWFVCSHSETHEIFVCCCFWSIRNLRLSLLPKHTKSSVIVTIYKRYHMNWNVVHSNGNDKQRFRVYGTK
jgi:hypothetical protein